ncbi:MAG: SMC-Scp complex subunit ScpB, partial [Candidatus Woesearchaeota archaeon]
MDEHLRKKIEAALFSVGKKMHIDQIMRLTKEKDKGKITACLIELKKKYEEEQNSLMILQDGDEWKLTIKDEYVDVAKELGVETELSKTVMETLAVIAYKNPAIQSDVIRIRTNKAYDHLKELEELGYIARERWGRTKRIKLTPKFFEYFDLPPESLKETFSNVKAMEDAIREKEHQAHEIKEKKKELLEEQKREERELEKHNIFIKKDNNVREVIKQDPHGMGIIIGERLGDLEVVDESEPQVVPKKENEVAVYDSKKNDEDSHASEELEDKEEEDTDKKEAELAEERPEDAFKEDKPEENEDIEEIQALKDSINQDEMNNAEENNQDEDLETDSNENYIDEDVTQEDNEINNQLSEDEASDFDENNESESQEAEQDEIDQNDDMPEKDEENEKDTDSSEEKTDSVEDDASENDEKNNKENEDEKNSEDTKEKSDEDTSLDDAPDENTNEEENEEKPEEFHARKPLKEEE